MKIFASNYERSSPMSQNFAYSRRSIAQRFAPLFIAAILLFSISTAFPQNYGQVPAPPQDHAIALVGGTVHTVSGAVMENATVLFENGKISAIGNDVRIPPGVERIDVAGKHVYPSMIDA